MNPGMQGVVEVICGCMFSGKTEELIRRAKEAHYAQKKVLLFKPLLDNRYSKHEIVSHNGLSIKAHVIKSADELLKNVPAEVDVIGIDEVQFFDDDVILAVSRLADAGHRIVVAGLDQDFRGEPFGPMPKLLALAEHVTKLHAICTVCGEPATRTQRLIDGEAAFYDDPVILVGAADSYEARCRNHHEVPVRSMKEHLS
ncbi:thymidine kinase [Bacillus thermophilus]|uniref:Thymidine kinase n=2 Tax=Bacillaceae TaxID=186817 RepID=A0ABS2R4F2_9BACI|nr:thymidine kinase [Siminovitchia thermophila]